MDGGDLRVLGVRHHGPGSARAVRVALDVLEPRVVVIEGPVELDQIASLAGRATMRPPVAALVYVPDEPRRASFYPMASFSPEWVALRWALQRGREVRFADLPAANHLAVAWGPEGRGGSEGPASVRADPLAALAAAAGFDDAERWWEDAVEHRHHGLDVFDAVLDAMTEVRAATGSSDAPDEVREAAMRRTLRAVLAAGDGPVAMVCGAWHAPVLVRERWPSVSSDLALLRGLRRVRVTATWVPWTSRRLSYASGYGAGVSSPGWYHHLFTAPDEPAARWLVRTARLLREEQLDTSSAAVIEATRLASALAALRGRPLAGLTELWEASEAVMTGGSPVPMRIVADRLLVGNEMGAVPEDTPMVPLARDLAATQRRLRLRASAAVSSLDLDLRRSSHLERSQLFHRLLLLDVPWAVPAETGRTTGTFRETWTLEWRPELDIALIEASMAGTTVVAAAVDTVVRRSGSADIAELCRLVEHTLLADLPEALDVVVGALAERTALQHDVLRLMAAVEPLARVARYGDVRGASTATLSGVLESIVRRVAVGLPPATGGLDDDAAADLRAAVDAVHRALATLDDAEMRDQWLLSLRAVLERSASHGLIAGRAARILLDAGRLSGADAQRRLSVELSTASNAGHAVAFLEGFLAGDALLLLHDRALLAIINDWISGVAASTFDDLLPLLRRAFSGYQPAERRMIGEQLSRLDTRSGLDGGGEVIDDDIDLERAARVRPLMRQLLGLPPLDGGNG